MNRDEFNEMFWSHFPPDVRALRPMIEAASHTDSETTVEDVKAEAVRLALAGFTLDPFIMCGLNVEPYTVIALRMAMGYAWYPALMEERNFDLAPGTPGGLGAAGVSARPYDPANPTRRYIPASLDPSAWPPFDPPKAVEVIPTVLAEPDGEAKWGTFLGVRQGDRSAIGSRATDPSGNVWEKTATATLAGVSVYWRRA